MLFLNVKKATYCVLVSLLLNYGATASGKSLKLFSLNSINRDSACGPRCLLAILRLTDSKDVNPTIKDIYNSIGRKPLSATTLRGNHLGSEPD